MALSSITRVADGIQSQFSFTFGYLSRSHVFLFVNNTLASYKWIGEFLLEPLSVPFPGDVVTIRRLTDRANRVTTYTDGQTLLAESLNAGDLQVFYIAQEMIDQIEEGIVAGDVAVLNPGTGYITAQWIQDQLTANLAAASQFGAIDAAIAAEATARAAAIAAEAAARTSSVLSLTAADAAAVGRLNIVESDLNTPTTGVKAKLVTVENAVTTEAGARASADTAILAEIDTPVTGLKARATSLESRTTLVEANKAEASALSALTARVTTAEADINAAEASIVSEASTRATADTANSTLISSLRADTQSRTSLTINPYFDQVASSPGLPVGWSEWIGGAANTTQVTKAVQPLTGLNARVNVPANGDNVGFRQYLALGTNGGAGKRFAVRASVRRVSGLIHGAGMLVEFWNSGYASLLSSQTLRFDTEVNTSGVASNQPDGRVTFEKVFLAPANTTNIVVYAMTNYPGTLGTGTAKSLDWYECSFSEIGGGVAGVTDLREAITTGSSSQARLLLNVNTATNAATIEAAAFAGDGTWNGSAITLNADLIRLLAKAINFGTNTVFEDTKGTIYTTTGGKRIRMLGPFGSTNNLLLWYGASSIGIDAETIANCDFCIATDGKGYYKAAELTTAAGPSRAKTGVGAASFSANNTWQTLGTVGYGDIPNPSTFSVTSIDLVGQSQSGVAVGSGYEWRVVHAPAANLSDVVVLRSGTFTVTAGGGGDPPVVSAISSVDTAPVSAGRYGAVNCFLQIQRTSGTATVGIQGTLNITSILP
jgi:hypothetical protein